MGVNEEMAESELDDDTNMEENNAAIETLINNAKREISETESNISS